MKKILLAVALLMAATPSYANLWKSCGIGHWIAGPTWNGYLAITTNVTWDLGTTATTSNSLSPSTCGGPFWAAANFINDTYPRLEEDTAQGQGEHLMAMLDIFDCDVAARNDVVNGIRSDFGGMVIEADYASKPQNEKAEAYFLLVEKNINQFSAQCNAV
ncbi:DUF3015 family protein [Vibrio tapetis subsp. quintayensis]|uniref:DUF3015 family protein n=1 Tax=Vibrio tapetis TaxID=52443 RepID=UPI0025B3AB4E|nr:DUF3015 family protein [Vibrio tapetis]MDN3680607.1 DUF3015 family protein [Vibrio tapetis subsp. quintayensis]